MESLSFGRQNSGRDMTVYRLKLCGITLMTKIAHIILRNLVEVAHDCDVSLQMVECTFFFINNNLTKQ